MVIADLGVCFLERTTTNCFFICLNKWAPITPIHTKTASDYEF